MNKKIEEEFVNTYIIKNKRERILFELQNPKRREEGIGRFCHCADEMLIASKITAKGKYILDDIKTKILDSNATSCYVISFFSDIDGIELQKQDVINEIIGMGMPSIAIFDDFVIIETEQEQGPAVKYLLEK